MSEYRDKMDRDIARERVYRIESVLADPDINAALRGKSGDVLEVLEFVQGLFIEQETFFGDRWLKAVIERHNRENAE